MGLPRDAFGARRYTSERVASGNFLCAACGRAVPAEAPGTLQRNHCPHCLASLHVDLTVGDRRSLCRGVMDPVSLWVREDGEIALLHRCRRCGSIRSNRTAGDDDTVLLRRMLRKIRKALETG